MNGNNGDKLMLVGVGASAGGVEALREFFGRVPADTGMAFVVVVHLAPGHESHLAEVLGAKTKMPVEQVSAPVRVEPNRVYVVPPDRDLYMSAGQIRLAERGEDGGRPAPIDLFFRTLAESYKDRAIAVVLSGAGADGSLGVRRVKEEGGVCLAQDPSEAEHPAMPRAAVETGAVDFVLAVAAMPEKLVSLRRNAERIQLPPMGEPPPDADERALGEVLALLRARTRHDFSDYKRSTLLRRVERRMQVTETEDLSAYLAHVREHPGELPALLSDLLISVTNFFRDPETFSQLEHEVVPLLFANRGPDEQVRVWVAGCATGEEAYSVAMLLSEYAEGLVSPPAIQVFASDIDEQALGRAREGVYPSSVEADIPPERLRRSFVREGRYYRVKRELRELVLFTPHNVLRDPPFSKLDLVSCRNLLIYINRRTQERVLEIFHFALRPGGHLFLGTSESAEGLPDLFVPVDKKHRLFRRLDSAQTFRGVPTPPEAGRWEARTSAALPAPGAAAEASSYGELHYRTLEALAPPSLLVNADYEIVHASETAGRFLRFAGGEPSRNLLKLVHPELQMELRSLLVRAEQSDGASRDVRVRLDGGRRLVRVSVRPVASPRTAPGFRLVVFEELPEGAGAREPQVSGVGAGAGAAAGGGGGLEQVVRQLEEDLQRTREQLRATVEIYETQAGEFKAGNEELQAMNEELRSASEELETGKEELQSVNEELSTLNNEYKERVEDLGRANSDLQNLMHATQIATLFLDRRLRIKRYTPGVQDLFNLIPTDVGRPLAHLTHRLDYAGLVEDAASVLRTLHTAEREAGTREGRHFMVRLMPYRTVEDRIDGVVITLVDITERKQSELELNRTNRLLQTTFDNSLQFIQLFKAVRDGRGVIIDFEWLLTNKQWNDRWGEMTGKRLLTENPAVIETGLFDRFKRVTETGVSDVQEHHYAHEQFDGWFWQTAAKVGDGFLLSTLDITERKRQEEALRASEEKYRTLFETIDEGFCVIELVLDERGRIADIVYREANAAFETHTGLGGVVGRRASELVPHLEQHWLDALTRVHQTGVPERAEGYNADMDRWITTQYSSVGGAGSPLIAAVFNDITERKRREANLAFLAEVSEDLVRLTKVDETMGALGAKVGGHFNVARVIFGEISEDRETGLVSHEWHRAGLPEMKGSYATKDYFSPEFKLLHRRGETAVVRDTARDGRVDAGRYAALGVGSFVGVPLLREGKWRYYFSLLDPRPRDWRADELELMRELANRIWTRLERARAEEALRESEEQFRRAILDAPIPVIMHAEDGEVLQVSRSWTELTGYALEDVPTLDAWLTRAYGEGADAVREHMHELFKGHRRSLNIEFPVRTRAGGLRHWSFSASSPGTLRDGRRFIVGMALDVTERMASAERLRESEERLRLVVESVEDYAILTLDTEGRIQTWNPGAERIFGYGAEEATGRHAEIIFTPEDRERGAPEEEMRQARETGRAADERWHVSKRGARFYVSGVMAPLRDGEGRLTGYAKIARDLTERREMEEALRRAHDEMEGRVRDRTLELAEANVALQQEVRERAAAEERVKGLLRQLVTVQEEERRRVARELHDTLGQQLTALRLSMDMIRAASEGRARLQEHIGRTEAIFDQLNSDVDFLAWELRPAALDQLGLDAALQSFVLEWGEHFGVEADYRGFGGEALRLPAEAETNLYRILQEALQNVHKHAGATRVSVILERRGGQTRLIVEDNGRGYDPEAEEAAGTNKGMGVTNMCERAALVGGTLEIESAPGQGTTIFVRVPDAGREEGGDCG